MWSPNEQLTILALHFSISNNYASINFQQVFTKIEPRRQRRDLCFMKWSRHGLLWIKEHHRLAQRRICRLAGFVHIVALAIRPNTITSAIHLSLHHHLIYSVLISPHFPVQNNIADHHYRSLLLYWAMCAHCCGRANQGLFPSCFARNR